MRNTTNLCQEALQVARIHCKNTAPIMVHAVLILSLFNSAVNAHTSVQQTMPVLAAQVYACTALASGFMAHMHVTSQSQSH
jgi:hypothetical protein